MVGRVEKIQGVLGTPDGYWRVEVVRYGPRDTWYRVLHAHTVLAERASIAVVQRILGDAFETLEPVAVGEKGGAA